MRSGRRYRIIQPLGKGGFGTVYEAEFLGEGGFRKSVALKILNPDMAKHTEIARRFRDEARVLGLVRHSAIVHVDGLVWLNGRWAVVMEYIEGVDVRALMAEVRVPPSAALTIAGEIADALHVAYHKEDSTGRALRLLHRDIKPSNVQLTSSGEVKILDFGTARADFSGREAETQALSFGTLDYMSPERYELIDEPAGDIYALGSMLYEMLLCERLGRTSPNPGDHQKLLALGQEKLQRLLEPEHQGIADLVLAMLAFDKNDRPNAKETEQRCADLHRAHGGERLREWAQRIIPPLIGKREIRDDTLNGSTLIEQSGAPSLDLVSGDTPPWDDGGTIGRAFPTVEMAGPMDVQLDNTTRADDFDTPASRPWPSKPVESKGFPKSVLFGGLFVLLTTIMGIGLLLVQTQAPQAPETPVNPESQAAPIKAKGTTSSPAEPVTTPSTRPATTPPPPQTGRVQITGDADSVLLLRAGKRTRPGIVPAGTYQIQAVFSGLDPMIAGQVNVVGGRTVTVDCSAAFTRCNAR